MANYLVTGAAGFIGARTSEFLIKGGHTVAGVDNLNDAYDPRIKEYRLKRLQALPEFTFHRYTAWLAPPEARVSPPVGLNARL